MFPGSRERVERVELGGSNAEIVYQVKSIRHQCRSVNVNVQCFTVKSCLSLSLSSLVLEICVVYVEIFGQM